MRTNTLFVPGYYTQQIADQVGSMGVDVDRWLALSQLTRAQLNEPEFKLPLETFRKLILDAMRITGEPALGLLVGERLLVNTHGLLGYAAINAESVRQLLELVQRFLPIRTNLVKVTYQLLPQQVDVRFEEGCPLLETKRPILEAVVLAIKNILDFITMGTCQVQQVNFPFSEYDGTGLAKALFKCDVAYNQPWAGFSFSADMLDKPLRMSNPAGFRDAALICQRELEKLTKQESLSMRVKCLMLEMRNGFPSLQVTARIFNMSARTLHRRLIDEGSSFKDILEEVKHLLAVEYLKAGELSVQEIAYTLGYNDVANFRRAFKRWEGVPPSEYAKKPG